MKSKINFCLEIIICVIKLMNKIKLKVNRITGFNLDLNFNIKKMKNEKIYKKAIVLKEQ